MSMKDWFERNFAPYPAPQGLTQSDGVYDGLQIDLSPPPKPRLVSVRRAPGRDEWNSWRDNPVTEFVMASLARNADEYADEWHRLSWVEGKCDPIALETLRARSDTLRGIAEADYEAFCEVLGLEPEEPPHAA